MLENRDFLIFSDDWGRHPFSCQHLMKHFLPTNRLLWVNTIGMRRPRLTLSDLRRSVEKVGSWIGRKEAPGPTGPAPTVLSPVMLPFGGEAVRRFNRQAVIRAVRQAMDELGMRSPVVLATVPNASEVLGAFEEALTVYYCVDEFAEWPGVDQSLVREMEGELLKRADLVVTVSGELQKSKAPRRGESRLLTHGVDVEHFAHRDCRLGLPSGALRSLASPIVGYFGLIDERTDQDLLEEVLRQRPGWSVVALGRSVTDLCRLQKYPNFHHLDAVPYERLPCYIAHFDVCLLPYVRSTLTDNINPLKLKECLTTGKPVVSTALPEAVRLSPWVRIARSSGEFIRKIDEALSSSEKISEAQIAAFAGESWGQKARQLSEWIDEALEEKTSAPLYHLPQQKGWSHAKRPRSENPTPGDSFL